MSRRRRAAVFALLAALCALLAAAAAQRYGSSVRASFGPLRPVVVTTAPLPAGRMLTPRIAGRALAVRRVPRRFVPAGALALPEQVLGRAPAADLPAGAYLLGTQLESPAPRKPRPAPRGAVIEIAVGAAEPLAAVASSRPRVDVVVTSEPRGAGRGRTYVAAPGVRLLALERRAPTGPAVATGWAATLAVPRAKALELIQAEAYARQIRLLPAPG